MDIILVTRRFTLADGTTAAKGTVTFELTAPLEDSAGNVVATTKEIKVPLIDGAFTQALVATNSPGLQPSGVTYKVTERLAPNFQRSYNVEIPFDATGGTVDLADLAPVEDQDIIYGVTLPDFTAHKNLTTGVHGITNTADLETKTGAQTKATAAQTAAIAAAATDATTKANAAQAAAALDATAKADAVDAEATAAIADVRSRNQATLGQSSESGGVVTVTYASNWGIDSAGDPYYDSAGAAAGEEAALIVGTDGSFNLVTFGG